MPQKDAAVRSISLAGGHRRLALQKNASVVVPANVIPIFALCPRQAQCRLTAKNRVGWCEMVRCLRNIRGWPNPTNPPTLLNLQGISTFSKKLGSVGGVGGTTGGWC